MHAGGQQAYFTADILTCHSRKSTCVTTNINNGSFCSTVSVIDSHCHFASSLRGVESLTRMIIFTFIQPDAMHHWIVFHSIMRMFDSILCINFTLQLYSKSIMHTNTKQVLSMCVYSPWKSDKIKFTHKKVSVQTNF